MALSAALVLAFSSANQIVAECRQVSFRQGLFGVLPGASEAIAVSDFNQDGNVDIASAQRRDDAVAIYLGRGGGSFSQPQDSPAGLWPQAIVAGDLSNDGKPDLIVLNFRSHVSVLLGRGNGTFENPRQFLLRSNTYPISVVASDFNRDGNLDVAAIGGYTIFVLLGNGHGDLALLTSIPVGNLPWGFASALATGDFDSDGRTDLAVTRLNDYDVALFLGTGSGSFVPGPIYGVERFPDELVVLDLNQDGHDDLVINSRESVGVSVLLGTGRAGFIPKPVIPASRYPTGLVVADFDGDDRFDLALGEQYDRRRLLFFHGNGDGTFQEPITISSDLASPRGALDFDGDGRRDLLVHNLKGLLLYAGDGAGRFRTPDVLVTSRYPGVVNVSDLDGDGSVDILVGTTWSARIDVFRGAGDGSFVRTQSLISTGPVRSIAIADLNRDSYRDAVVSTAAASCASPGGPPTPCPGPNVSVFLGRSEGGFEPARVSQLAGTDPGGLVVGDFNRDGWSDVVVTDSRLPGGVVYLAGLRGGELASPLFLETGGAARSIAAADLDGNGTTDLAVAGDAAGAVSVLLGRGDGTFISTPALSAGERPVSIASGDLDRDGRLDLVTANSAGPSVSVFRGMENGRFELPVEVPLRWPPSSIIIKDVTGDGVPDVVVSVFFLSSFLTQDDASAVAIISGAAASLASPFYLRVGLHPASVASGDFNGDGRADIVTVNSSSDDISVLLNRCKSLPPVQFGRQ